MRGNVAERARLNAAAEPLRCLLDGLVCLGGGGGEVRVQAASLARRDQQQELMVLPNPLELIEPRDGAAAQLRSPLRRLVRRLAEHAPVERAAIQERMAERDELAHRLEGFAVVVELGQHLRDSQACRLLVALHKAEPARKVVELRAGERVAAIVVKRQRERHAAQVAARAVRAAQCKLVDAVLEQRAHLVERAFNVAEPAREPRLDARDVALHLPELCKMVVSI